MNWMDLFTRKEYTEVITNSLSYCISNKGLILNAWCIMTNHLHLIIRSESNNLSDIIRDLKKFTSYKLYTKVKENNRESRKTWLKWMFERAGKQNGSNKNFQVWQQDNHPVELNTHEKMEQRLNYLHMNPVNAGYVIKPEDWLNSSARHYARLEQRFELELIE